MVLAICDDDKCWCDTGVEILEAYARDMGETWDVQCFPSKEQLLDYQGAPIDILFMDIELGPDQESGIALARLINRKWTNCQIVYLTNYLYYATEVYETQHLYFILKEQFSAKLGKVLDKLHHQREQGEEKCIFRGKGGVEVSVSPRDIRYLERSKRYTNLITTWGTYVIMEKIDEIYPRLPQLDFVKCHTSYLVYLPHIRELKKNEIITQNQELIPISRRYQQEVKNKFARWAVTQMG